MMIIYLIGVLLITFGFLFVLYDPIEKEENIKFKHITRLASSLFLGVTWPFWFIVLLALSIVTIVIIIYSTCLYFCLYFYETWKRKVYTPQKTQIN